MSLRRSFGLLAVTSLITVVASCGSDISNPCSDCAGEIRIASIIIDGGSQNIEIGTIITLTAKVTDTSGKLVTVPLVWKSTVDSIASFAPNGVLTVKDTGVTIVTASALGVTSGAIQVHGAWNGAAKIDTLRWAPANAVMPGMTPQDSVRFVVTGNALKGLAVAQGATVVFAATEGGGTVSPRVVTVGSTGIVATKWTLGPTVGVNTLTATVVGTWFGKDSVQLPKVTNNPFTLKVKTYNPLAIVQGDGQTANILTALPLNPSIRLTDSAGKPRAGVPITFAPTGNGRVASTVVPTSVDGIASPGVWTLGDATGDQQLVVSLESAKISLHATATGSTVQFAATQLATTQLATCALTNDQFASCFGRSPQIGTGDTASQSKPTLTKGGFHFTALAGAVSGAHICGTTTDFSIYCWGIGALVDTSNKTTFVNEPTRLPGNIAWLQVAAGGTHNCGLANDHTAYCWGDNSSGQLGDNSTTAHYPPAPVLGGFKFNSIAAGNAHTCGLTTDAAAFCWGSNANGQLGDGTTIGRIGPTAVSGGLKFQYIGAGSAWTCGLSSGVAYCWGAGTSNVAPGSYASAPTFSSLSVGSSHACGIASDGTAYCWGDNSAGQLGDSTTTTRLVPTAVSTELKFRSISAGFQHTCAITTDGFVACWGRNQFGEIGVSVPTTQVTPRFVILGVNP